MNLLSRQSNLSKRRNGRLLLKAMVSLFVALWFSPAYAQEATGHWEYKWFKAGQSSWHGVYNNYDNFPHYSSQQNLGSKTSWPKSDHVPLPLGLAIGDYMQGFTDENASNAMQGTYGLTLVWVPGTSNDPAPRKIYVLDQLTSEDWLEAIRYEPFPPYIHNYSSQAKNGISPPVTGQVATDGKTAGAYSGGFKMHVIDNSARHTSVTLPSYYLLNAASFNLIPGESVGGDIYASTTRGIAVAQLQLEVRRHSAANTNNNQSGFSGSATIAAGGQEPDEHIADVRVKVVMGGNAIQSRAGISVPFKSKIIFGDGVAGQDVVFTPVQNPVTDDSGYALIGTLKSSDKLTYQTPQKDHRIRLELELDLGADNPKAYINQNWDDQNQWEAPPYFVDVPNPNTDPTAPSGIFFPVVFKPQFNGIPIIDHSLSFTVHRVQIARWDVNSQTMQTQIVTVDKSQENSESYPSVVWGNPADYVSADMAEVADVTTSDTIKDGIYHANFRIHPPRNVTVEQMWFKAKDNGVFKAASGQIPIPPPVQP